MKTTKSFICMIISIIVFQTHTELLLKNNVLNNNNFFLKSKQNQMNLTECLLTK